eukprot:XP_024463936.1 exocyst complex component EXO84C-like [Populus trichocarpa]
MSDLIALDLTDARSKSFNSWIASAIIARAIRTFSARGIDPQSALPEDEWFVETAKTAINKLLLGASRSDTSEINKDRIILHDEMASDSNDTVFSPFISRII